MKIQILTVFIIFLISNKVSLKKAISVHKSEAKNKIDVKSLQIAIKEKNNNGESNYFL
jgi:hypothetical protein